MKSVIVFMLLTGYSLCFLAVGETGYTGTHLAASRKANPPDGKQSAGNGQGKMSPESGPSQVFLKISDRVRVLLPF
jgi:hypothetical protein